MHMQLIMLMALITMSHAAAASKFTANDVKCHVCKATVQEMEDAIAKEDPNKTADVSAFRLDAQGNSVSKSIRLIKSEMYLTELMEEICEKMEDYARATHKKTGKLMLLKMIVDGKMNPDASNVDFIQDGDLNKSLKHYCLEVLEDNEEAFLKAFQAQELGDDLDIQICSTATKYCDDAPIQEDYTFDDFKEEL